MGHHYSVYGSPGSKRAQKKLIAWIFQFFLSWEFRVTLCCCVDVLDILWKTKKRIEGNYLDVVQVTAAIQDAKDELSQFCEKGSALADSMISAGPGGCYHVETAAHHEDHKA